jgi:large subunit ribosomal protein L23
MGILIRPIITEKMTAMSEKTNRYGFVVRYNANKLEIKKAIEDLYNVTVKSVNTMKYTGKNTSRFTKTGVLKGRTEAFKKAIIALKEGEAIDLYSNI